MIWNVASFIHLILFCTLVSLISVACKDLYNKVFVCAVIEAILPFTKKFKKVRTDFWWEFLFLPIPGSWYCDTCITKTGENNKRRIGKE